MSADMPPMPDKGAMSRRNILIGSALLGTAALAWVRTPRAETAVLGKNQFNKLLPKQLGAWSFESESGLVLPPSDQLRDQIYKDIVTRVYTRPDGAGVMLLVAYGGLQDGVVQVHRPEVCYPASGFTLSGIREHDIAITPQFKLPTRYMVATSRARTEQLLYWTRFDDQFPTNWLDQRLAVAKENLKGKIPDGVLVRVSTMSPDGDTGSIRILDDFVGAMINTAKGEVRRILIGRAAG